MKKYVFGLGSAQVMGKLRLPSLLLFVYVRLHKLTVLSMYGKM